ncbi:Hypothetical predicted protein [Pelobates cultripes]|uniref:Uncharacterized protein n=1 Tax=Pelobates cultripes TaxID=61616 RepID=A0AAD1RYU1_PELCU|nr:Hypothetical predicted protein [Pelobates cultripes]
MVRTKKPLPSGAAAASSPHRNTGPMDDFLATPSDLCGTRHVDKMAPGSPDSEMTGDSQSEPHQTGDLSQIRMELSQISRRMLTKADTGPIVQELRAALREELAGLRADLSTLEQRVDEMESVARGCDDQHRATEVAVTRQGNMLLTLRRQVEDLENRSRRNNIRVRSLPERADELLPDTLSALFTQLLGAALTTTLIIDSAHRALGPARQDGSPRDVVCCIVVCYATHDSHWVTLQIILRQKGQEWRSYWPAQFRLSVRGLSRTQWDASSSSKAL